MSEIIYQDDINRENKIKNAFNFLSSLQQMSLEGVTEKLKISNLIADRSSAALNLNQIKIPRCNKGMEDLSKGCKNNYVAYEAKRFNYSTLMNFCFEIIP